MTQSMCDVMVFAGLTCSLVMVYIMKCDRICEKGSYTHIQFFDFKDV